VKVIDRDEVVLEIFDINARTKESRLQIELARLALQSNLIRKEIGQHLDEKQGRDFMGKGMPGWAPVARAFTSRRKKIVTELKDIAQARNLRRKQRSKFFNIGIVGYTNAGKTTLLNALAKESLETANQEFTTVSTTSRRVKLPTFNEYGGFIGEEVIFTDSVGFIYDISHFLIEAFLSTLEELQFSDLIAIVVDIADKQEERLFLKIETSFSVMGQIGANTIPKIFIFNKADSIEPSLRDARINTIHEKYSNIPYAVISAANRTGFDGLTALLVEQKKKIRAAKF
jgi:GTP-binding protein HflX